MKILVVGATGSIGRLVVVEAIRQGHQVRALVRSEAKARELPKQTEAVVGDLTKPETLVPAVHRVDAVVFTQGSDGGGKAGAESVDYGGVRNVLLALHGRPVRIALMTAIGVTDRKGSYNRSTEAHDWKRRAERLVRASGSPYTIVRPGWFDYNGPDQHKLDLLQGDTRHAGRLPSTPLLDHERPHLRAGWERFRRMATRADRRSPLQMLSFLSPAADRRAPRRCRFRRTR